MVKLYQLITEIIHLKIIRLLVIFILEHAQMEHESLYINTAVRTILLRKIEIFLESAKWLIPLIFDQLDALGDDVSTYRGNHSYRDTYPVGVVSWRY